MKKNPKQKLKNAQLSYADYTGAQHKDINDMILMCSSIDESNIDALGGIFKLAIMSGSLRAEDAFALIQSDPYLIKIIIGGLRTSLPAFIKSLYITPVNVRTVFDALLKYKKLIISDYLANKARIDKIHTRNPLSGAIYDVLPKVNATRPITAIFGMPT